MNPFLPAKTPDPWGTPLPVDVAGIYRTCRKRVIQQLESIRNGQSDQAKVLLLLGDEGAGKTHFLAQIYDQLRGQQIFASVSAPPSIHRIYRSILGQLTGDLGRVHVLGLDQLTWAATKALSVSLKTKLIASFIRTAQTDPAQMRHAISETLLNIQTEYPNANADVLAKLLALPFLNADLGEQIRWWLAGTPVSDEAKRVLRINFEIDSEDLARTVLLTLDATLAYTQTPLLLSYDGLESLSAFPDAPESLAQFIGDMNKNAYSILSVIAARPEVWAEYLQPLLDTHFDRAPKNVLSLPAPNRAQALAIVRARLGSQSLAPLSEDDVYRAFERHGNPGGMLGDLAQLWAQQNKARGFRSSSELRSDDETISPFGRQFALAPDVQMNISEEKTVVMQIVESFEDEEDMSEPLSAEWNLDSLEFSVSSLDSSGTDSKVWAALDLQLDRRMREEPEATFDLDDSLPGILMTINALGSHGTSDLAISGLPKDVLAVLRHHDAPLIIVLGNHASGNAFAYRIRWLVKQAKIWLPKEPGFRAIMLRDEERPLPKGWKKGRQYIDELKTLNGEFIPVSGLERAILHTGREALEGEIPIELERLQIVMGLPSWPKLQDSVLLEKLIPKPAH